MKGGETTHAAHAAPDAAWPGESTDGRTDLMLDVRTAAKLHRQKSPMDDRLRQSVQVGRPHISESPTRSMAPTLLMTPTFVFALLVASAAASSIDLSSSNLAGGTYGVDTVKATIDGTFEVGALGKI